MKANKDQIVNYVAPPAKEGDKPTIKKAKVLEAIGESAVRLDYSPKFDGSNVALAHYNEDKTTPNTFHFPESQDAAPAPATPGVGKGK